MKFQDPANPYQSAVVGVPTVAALAQESERSAFIRRTYLHLAGAILAFVGIEAILFTLLDAQMVIGFFRSPAILVALIGCMVTSWVADYWARQSSSVGLQYFGLGLYVVFQALFMAPFLFLATMVGSEILPTAAIMTGIIFGGLTVTVLVTKADFSWLRGILVAVSLGVMGLWICSFLFTFSLGLGFTVAMIVFASAIILYQTSQIMRTFHTDQHVAAALGLFASVILLLYYVTITLIRLYGND